jgi:dipeptidyl-peptidase 4
MHSPVLLLSLLLFFSLAGDGQLYNPITWSKDGNAYYTAEEGGIAKYHMPDHSREMLLRAAQLQPAEGGKSLRVVHFFLSESEHKILVFTNSKKVWRYETRGDYWVYDLDNHTLKQLGKTLPASSLMFAKFSPDGNKAAYVSRYNIYVEDLASGNVQQLTRDGSRKMINGTFDWVYEEELNCRDGFRWSPDSRSIAFWQIADSTTRDYLMLNTTDSVYSHDVPVEYPVAGQMPSPYRIGVVDLEGAHVQWMNIPSDEQLGTYLPRMEWAANSSELIVQHLSRRQNESTLMLCSVKDGSARAIYRETDSAWIEVISEWDEDYKMGGWDWLNKGAEFLWPSEKDGWKHLYRVSRDGKKEQLITRGNYDVIDIVLIDEKGNQVYFMASPDNATQQYLYRCRLDGKGNAERVTAADQPGTHQYEISPNGLYAMHSFSNYYTPRETEWISLPDKKPLPGSNHILPPAGKEASNIEFFTVKTEDGVDMDGWMQKPAGFDPKKKYPVLFFVYTEPATQTVTDHFGIGRNPLYKGDLAKDGYIYISLDGRGTPAPKGRAWRRAIYRKIGQVNIRDQAMAARQILQWPFVDTARIAVWGWSGGGSATLNLLFQYPEIYKTGIAIAAVGNILTYDNIYQERFMGIPQETREDYLKGSAITYAKNLRGNLLYIHGTGDDNVHYNNAEMLINELIKYDKQFQFMPYPNRSHSISEGSGTREHLGSLYTAYLREHCPGGPK